MKAEDQGHESYHSWILFFLKNHGYSLNFFKNRYCVYLSSISVFSVGILVNHGISVILCPVDYAILSEPLFKID